VVDPVSEEERAAFLRRVKIGVTLLIGGSAGLVSLQVDPTAVQATGAVAAGLVVGYALAWFIVPSGPAPATQQRRRRERTENPFADGGDGGGSEELTDKRRD
jgi:hypothetical protein